MFDNVFIFSSGINYSHPTMKSSNNETLRRGMSIALNPSDKPAPPVRRTPSINANGSSSQQNCVNIHSTRFNVRTTHTDENNVESRMNSNNNDHEFPPPPPDFLLNNDSPVSSAPSNTAHVQSTLLNEIQRGGFKLRKTTIDRDRSAPRIR
jgi:hypothetical protein